MAYKFQTLWGISETQQCAYSSTSISYLTANTWLPKLFNNLFVLSLIQSHCSFINCIKIHSDSVDQKSFTVLTHANDFCLSWHLFSREKESTINTKQPRAGWFLLQIRVKYINVVHIPFVANFIYNIVPGRGVCQISSVLVRIAWWWRHLIGCQPFLTIYHFMTVNLKCISEFLL